VATTNRHLGSIFFRIALLTHVSFANEAKKGRKKVNGTGQFREPTNRWHPYFFEGKETLQRIATHCNALQCTAMHCNAMQCTAMQRNAHLRTAERYNALQRTATHCIVPRRTATHCRTLQHLLPVTHCSIQVSSKETYKKNLPKDAKITLWLTTILSIADNLVLTSTLSIFTFV